MCNALPDYHYQIISSRMDAAFPTADGGIIIPATETGV